MGQNQVEITRLEERLRTCEEKLLAIEETRKSPTPHSKDVWDWLQAISALLVPFMVVFIGFLVKSALQKPQIQLSNAKGMQGLLAELENPDVDQPRAEAAAKTLATFGSPAVAPLISVLQSGGIVRALAAADGLREAGMIDHAAVCNRLTQVIANRTQLFTWLSQKSAIHILGDLDCKNALPALVAYRALVERTATADGLKQYTGVVRVDQSIPLDADALKTELKRTLEILERSAGGPS